MPRYVKVMLPSDLNTQFEQFTRRKFHDAPATTANHVVMRILAEGVLVMGLFDVESDLFQHTAVDKERERSVNRGLADFQALFSDEIENLFGFKVLRDIQDRLKNRPTGCGLADTMVA